MNGQRGNFLLPLVAAIGAGAAAFYSLRNNKKSNNFPFSGVTNQLQGLSQGQSQNQQQNR